MNGERPIALLEVVLKAQSTASTVFAQLALVHYTFFLKYIKYLLINHLQLVITLRMMNLGELQPDFLGLVEVFQIPIGKLWPVIRENHYGKPMPANKSSRNKILHYLRCYLNE